MAFPWPEDPPSEAHRAAFADATVRPYWLDALPPREPAAAARGAVRRRPVHRRRRLHRAVGGAARQGRRPRPRRRRARGRHDRLRRERAQRRLRARLAHARDRERPRALRRRDAAARAARQRELRTGFVADLERLGIDCDLEPTGDLSVALEPHEVGVGRGVRRAARAPRPRARGLRRAPRSGPRSPRRPTSAAIWDKTDAARRRPGQAGAWASQAPRCAPASASTSARRATTIGGRATACGC